MSLLEIDKLEPISIDWLKSLIIKYLKLYGYVRHGYSYGDYVRWSDVCDWDHIRTNPDQCHIYINRIDYNVASFYVGSSLPKSMEGKFKPLYIYSSYKYSDYKLLSIKDIYESIRN